MLSVSLNQGDQDTLVLQARLEDANFLLKIDHQNAGKKKSESDSRIILKCILWKRTW
jgi:hypothetical protein